MPPPWRDLDGFQNVSAQGRSRLIMGNRRLAITIRCFPLPKSILPHLNSEKLALVKKLIDKKETYGATSEFSLDERFHQFWNEIVTSLTPNEETTQDLAYKIDPSLQHSTSFSTNCGDLHGFDLFSRLISLGPNGCGPNFLLYSPDCRIDVVRDLVEAPINENESPESIVPVEVMLTLDRINNLALFERIISRLKSAIITGFQFASLNGPLMAEPLYGVGFVIEKVDISQHSCGVTFDVESAVNTNALEGVSDATINNTVISIGQLISDVKDTMKICLLSANIRLVEPVYKCNIQCDQSQLGNLYSVLSKRRGDVVDEDIIEGTTFFILTVVLPVIESFGFAQELLKKTSGSATAPQLFFSHWEIMNEDPFWKPTTAEELEDLGEVVHEANLPRQRIDAVRRRKGLVVEEKIVIHAEKQRTLTRNK